MVRFQLYLFQGFSQFSEIVVLVLKKLDMREYGTNGKSNSGPEKKYESGITATDNDSSVRWL